MIRISKKQHLVLLIIFGLFLAALISRNAGLAWMTMPFLVYFGAGLLTVPGVVNLHASRSVNRPRCESGTPITMTVTIENMGPAVPLLHVSEAIPPKLRLANGIVERSVTLPARETTRLCYTFETSRGQYRWDTVQVTVSDSFGLFERSLELPATAELHVLPGQLPLKQLRLRPRQTLQVHGPNLSRRPGSGVDFFGVREYHSGDPLRWVHWRLSARHPRKFFSKEFEREEAADIGLIIDGSAAANLSIGTESLLEYSIMAAASLSKNLLRKGNRVSLLALGEHIARVYPGSGKRQLVRILNQLAACQPGENISLNTLKYLPVRLFPSRSTIVIISPLRASDFPAIARLRGAGYQLLLVSMNPVQFASRETDPSLAVRTALLERRALLWRIRELGVQVIDWSVDQPLLTITDTFLMARG